jgi:hypothetical protein
VIAHRAIVGCLGLACGFRLALGCSADGARDRPVDASAPPPPPASSAVETYPPPYVPTGGRPDGLPEGWELERSLDMECNLYVPTRRELLPPPIAWEPCPKSAKPAGVKCRRVVEESYWRAEAAWVKPDGGVLFAGQRSARPAVEAVYWLVADADGVVHTAMVASEFSPCWTHSTSLFGGHYTRQIRERWWLKEGAFASSIDDLAPRIAFTFPDGAGGSFYAGPFAVLDLTANFELKQYSWEDGSPLRPLWSPARRYGVTKVSFAFAKDGVFWSAERSGNHDIESYDPASGIRVFLTAWSNKDRGYDDLGTDGQHLVWIEANDRASDGLTFNEHAIMTAPYTTDPAKLTPRRLRSEEGDDFGSRPFIVGCGYAARANGRYIRLVRIADGRSWRLETDHPDADASMPWRWEEPLAITCDELFANATSDDGGGTRIVRARLDSLGPGLAAD